MALDERGRGMTNEDIVEIAHILHHRWSEYALSLESVKHETDDGSKDWALFHETQLNASIKLEQDSRELKDRFLDEHRQIIRESFGL